MNRTDLKELLVKAASQKRNEANFSDVQSAAKNALKEYFKVENITMRQLLRDPSAFAIIEEVVDEVVPQKVEDRTAAFADIQNFGRNEDVVFKVPTSNSSRRRMYKALKKGARGGIYKAYRLDGYSLTMETEVYSVGYLITLEEILTGTRTVAELIEIVTNSWVEKIFVEVMEALNTAAAAAPATNRHTGAFSESEMDTVIRYISGYGDPVIMGFRTAISKIANPAGGSYPQADYDDIRNSGYVSIYKGTPVIELPNYLLGHTGTPSDWLFTEDKLYVVPQNERFIKVAFKGESFTAEVDQPHGGKEWHNHRMMGVAALFNNAIGSYTFTS